MLSNQDEDKLSDSQQLMSHFQWSDQWCWRLQGMSSLGAEWFDGGSTA